jgi:hypothetical protein
MGRTREVAERRERPSGPEFRTFVQNVQDIVQNFEFSRMWWVSQQGVNQKGRNLEKECGYPVGHIPYSMYDNMYQRSDIAKRVVDLFPDETWAVDPELTQSPDPKKTTRIERIWKGLLENPHTCPWLYMHRADQLSGIGAYSVIYLGFDDGLDPSKPVAGLDNYGNPTKKPRENKLLYTRVFTQDLAPIGDTYRGFTAYPNLLPGYPLKYNVTFSTPRVDSDGQTTDEDLEDIPIHWTRLLHVADNRMSSELYGLPRMKPVFNRLLDLRKILGSSAEMFYKGGWPGHSIEQMPNVPEDLELDEDSIRDQMDKYYNNIKRYVAFVGATVKSLAPNIADPDAHIEQQFRTIAAAMGCPLRVFLGSEAAHLASTQDIQTWNKRIAKRQKTYVNPLIITPYVQRLQMCGVLPPADKLTITWKDMNALSDKDKADVSLKKAQALLQYVSSGAEKVYPLLYFLTMVMDTPDQLAQVIVDAAKSAGPGLTKEIWKQPTKLPPGSGKKDASKKTASGSTRNATGKSK